MVDCFVNKKYFSLFQIGPSFTATQSKFIAGSSDHATSMDFGLSDRDRCIHIAIT